MTITPKLGKTALALLAQIKARGRVCVSRGYGRGADGGRVHYGSREFAAGMQLVKAGLAQTQDDITRSMHTRHGWSIHHADMLLIPATKED